MQPSKKQERARTRNWQKARLKCFHLNRAVLLPEEREKYDQMLMIQENLLYWWDINTPFVNNQTL